MSEGSVEPQGAEVSDGTVVTPVDSAEVASVDSGEASADDSAIGDAGTYTANADGTIEINGKTYVVEEIDKPMPPKPDNPQDCPDCGKTFERHEIVLGKCQDCNTKSQEAEKAKGASILAGIEKLLGGGK